MSNKDKNMLNKILDEIAYLDPENILFNYECCGNCSDTEFDDKE